MRLALLVTVSLLSCAPISAEPAPEGLSANVRWFWTSSDSATDATVRDATKKLAAAGMIESRTAAYKSVQKDRLAPSDLEVVGLSSSAVEKARGLLVVNLFDCRLDTLADILSADDQMTLYPDTWAAHARTATADRQAFLERRSPRYSWDADVAVTFPVSDQYQSKLKGSLRRVPDDGSVGSDVLVARLWLTAPATFAAGSQSAFNQNYEMEVFWEPTPGRIAHAYGMWREVKIAAFNITLEEEDLVKITLDNLVTWDTKTAALCAKR